MARKFGRGRLRWYRGCWTGLGILFVPRKAPDLSWFLHIQMLLLEVRIEFGNGYAACSCCRAKPDEGWFYGADTTGWRYVDGREDSDQQMKNYGRYCCPKCAVVPREAALA